MRDKNLNLKDFSIQLEKKVLSQINKSDDKFLRNPVLVTPTRLLDSSQVGIVYPKDFRKLRSLIISQWFFPEFIHWRILLDLQEKNFNQLNKKQRLELAILLSSKENCIFYLWITEKYSGNEIFGNLLGNDLKETLKFLRIFWKKQKQPTETIRRRGYKDKGSLRPSHRWLPDWDFSFTEQQNQKENQEIHLQSIISRILRILENLGKLN